jgi:hypothetical protein
VATRAGLPFFVGSKVQARPNWQLKVRNRFSSIDTRVNHSSIQGVEDGETAQNAPEFHRSCCLCRRDRIILATRGVRTAGIDAGEAPAAYEDLRARISAVVRPADFLEDDLGARVVDLTWDTLRMRRLKANMLT